MFSLTSLPKIFKKYHPPNHYLSVIYASLTLQALCIAIPALVQKWQYKTHVLPQCQLSRKYTTLFSFIQLKIQKLSHLFSKNEIKNSHAI